MAQQLVQNGQAFNVLNQYSLNELLNVDPDMAYNALQVMEGSADEGNAIEALEQFSQAQLWQAMLDCMNDVLIQVFTNYPGVTNSILINLCQVDRNSMNEIANDMGYTDYTSLSNQELVDLLVGDGRFDELNNLIKTYFSNQQIVLGTGSSSFSLKNFLLNTYGYGGFLEAIKCYDNEQLKQFLTTGTLSQSLVKTYLISSVYQQFLLEKLNAQNFVLYLQYVLQQNNINSINYAITNMQTQPVYNYLTWVKQSFGNSAYNSLASNLEFTRTLKLNDWQLYGSSRLGVYNADTTLTNITFTINGMDSNGNFEVNQVISQTNVSVNHYDMQHFLAYKQYELTNHLGNVLATVLDRKTNNKADVVTAQHYYPFGSVMSSYKAEEFGYRFGFNTQMKDDEVFEGAYSAEFWEYDSRLGRRWNLDPVAQINMSDYSVLRNCPMLMIDFLGDKIINGMTAQVKEAEDKKDEAQKKYDELVQNHQGELTDTDKNKYREQSGLKLAESRYFDLKEKETKINDMINTYRLVFPKAFDRIDQLKIDVVINYSDEMGSSPLNPAAVNIPASRTININSKTGYETIYWDGSFTENTITISLFGGGDLDPFNTEYLANEFADILYFQDNVKINDPESFKKWEITGSDKYPGYWDDPTGAGQQSFKHQREFKKEFNKKRKEFHPTKVDAIHFIIHE